MSIESADNVTERIVEITHEITRSIKGKEGIAIAADISEMLHSIKRMSRSVNYTHSFWRIVLTEVMLLFDAPMVRIRTKEGDKDHERKNVLEDEYNAIIDAEKLERCKKKRISEEHILRLPDDKDNPFKDTYIRATEQLKDEKTPKKIIDKIIQESSIQKSRLFGIIRLVVIPLEMSNGHTGTIEIYLDAEPREPQNYGRSKRARNFLIDDKNKEIIKKIFSVIYELETDPKLETEVAPYSLLEDKEQFLAEAGFAGDDKFPDFDDFEEQFRERFYFINRKLAEIWSGAQKKIEPFRKTEKEQKKEEERKHYLTFAIGERRQGDRLVYSYFLPSVEKVEVGEYENNIGGTLEDALKRFKRDDEYNDFTHFTTLWRWPFEFGSSVMGYISRAGGFPEYIVDIDKDRRVLAYQPKVGRLEKVLIGFEPKYAMEIPIVLIPNNGEYELRFALVFFSKEPIPLHIRWDLYDLAYDAKDGVRTALSDQEEHRERATRQRAEDWMYFTIGLTHEFANEIQCYSFHAPRIRIFLETLQNYSERLPESLWQDFRSELEQELLRELNIKIPTKESLNEIEAYTRECDFDSIIWGTRWIEETNKERMGFVEFLQKFADYLLKKSQDIEELNDRGIVSLPELKDKIRARIREVARARNLEPAEKWQNQEIILEGDCTNIDNADEAVVRFILHEMIKNALKFSRWILNGEIVPVRLEVSRQRDLINIKTITHLAFFAENAGYCQNCGKRAKKRYRPKARIAAVGYHGFLCDNCFHEEMKKTLKICGSRGDGSGLFMIQFLIRLLYSLRVKSDIITWDENKDERLVYFEIQIPNDVEAFQLNRELTKGENHEIQGSLCR